MMALRVCVRRHGRLPQTLIVDGGKEFHSRYFDSVLACYYCTKKTRPWAQPRYGAVIERLCGTTTTAFIHNLLGRSYWIPGSYAPALSEKHNSFLRLLKNKGFKEERMTKAGLYAIANPRPWNPTRAFPLSPVVGPAPVRSTRNAGGVLPEN